MGIYKIQLQSCLHHWKDNDNYFQSLPDSNDLVFWACKKILKIEKGLRIQEISWKAYGSYIKIVLSTLRGNRDCTEEFLMQWDYFCIEEDLPGLKEYFTNEDPSLRRAAKKIFKENSNV